ncbi:MAG: antitoxin [Candidimonas sp.]|nr:MAG: antitoxin [Candidimonas sp.]
MGTTLPPIVSEFETEEQAASYDRWFLAKVQASRDDPRPSIPHDQAMAMIREKLAAKLAEEEKSAGKPRNHSA